MQVSSISARGGAPFVAPGRRGPTLGPRSSRGVAAAALRQQQPQQQQQPRARAPPPPRPGGAPGALGAPPPLQRAAQRAAAALCAAAVVLAPLPGAPLGALDPAVAADVAKVGTCLLSKCQVALAKCLGDGQCLQVGRVGATAGRVR
jgi:hypothetical protein